MGNCLSGKRYNRVEDLEQNETELKTFKNGIQLLESRMQELKAKLKQLEEKVLALDEQVDDKLIEGYVVERIKLQKESGEWSEDVSLTDSEVDALYIDVQRYHQYKCDKKLGSDETKAQWEWEEMPENQKDHMRKVFAKKYPHIPDM